MTVLVTGAGGFLGRNLTRSLTAAGHRVRGMFRRPPEPGISIGCAEVVVGDLGDAASLARALAGSEGCVHCAAAVSLWPAYTREARVSTVTGTERLLTAARAAGVARMVHVGSASSFGYGSRRHPGTERSPYRGRGYRVGYLDYKYAAHQVAARHAAAGAPVVMVAPTFMLGAFDTHYGSSQLLLQVARTAVVPCPSGGRNFVFVADVASAIGQALVHGTPGQSYILGHRNLPYRRLIEIIAAAMGRRRTSVMLPPVAVRAVGAVGSAFGLLTRRPPALSSGVACMAGAGHYYSADRAVRELQLAQTPLETALAIAWRWLREQGVA